MVLAIGVPAGAAQVVESAYDRGALVLRTYTQPAYGRDMAAARATAEGILSLAGVPVAWLECGLPPTAAACAQALRPNEIVVRVLSAGTADAGPHAETLGVAFVDGESRGGSLATVFADRVQALARTACVNVGELLGRTLAHEIGHLLLGTNAHAPHGLMRASWSAVDLRRQRAFQWLFAGQEVELLRKGLLARGVRS
jgi:hypothetical protein